MRGPAAASMLEADPVDVNGLTQLFFMLYFLRHDMVSWVIAVVAISLLALFMFIPNRVYLSLLASAFLSIGLMACVAARGMGAEKVIGLGFILVLVWLLSAGGAGNGTE